VITNRVVVLAAAVLAVVVSCGRPSQVVTVMAPPPDGAVITRELPTDPATMPRGPLVREVAPELEELADAVGPGLVNIYVYKAGTNTAVGTGIVLTSQGLVVTNAHVTGAGDRFLAVDNGDRRTYRAVLVGADPSHDLAVLRMQDASHLHVTPRGDSDRLQAGDRVASLGYAYAQGRVWIGEGPITRLNLTIYPRQEKPFRVVSVLAGMIEAQSSVLPGESGGAMVTTDGVVVGVNQGVGAWDTSTASGYGYAIPINSAMRVVNQILSNS
jgi:putative serine protease PepD